MRSATNNKTMDNQNINNKKEEHEKSSDYLYLEKLTFNPELRKTWLNFFVTNFRVVILMIILLTALGAYSFLSLPRESSPEVKIPIAIVITSYPGASPADIEELVTKKLETEISGLKDISKITSQSSNSISSITVEFDAKADLDDSIRKLRDAANNAKSKLPSDANDPVVREISLDDQPIWSISLTGPYDGATLRQAAEEIQDELEAIADIREVNISGGDQKEFEVAYDPQKLTIYGISADQANQKIKATNLAIPAGSFEGREYTYPVRGDARFFDEQKLANIPLMHTDEGAIVFLKDVARVQETNIERTVYSRLSISGQEPREAININIIKKTGGSIIDSVDEAKIKVDHLLTTLPAGMTYDVTMDMAKYIRNDFAQLSHDFKLTVLLVFGILFLIVGFKEAIVAGLAVPLVFFVTFGVMLSTGISLNFLSILSLLLSLGLLVDDAIVVVSATKQYMNSGKFTPEEAVLLVLNDFKVVLTTTTLTTVWAFLPLLSASGIIGSYIRSIPITVSVTLIASLFIALMINHPLAAVLERVRLTRGVFYANVLLLIGAITYAISTGGFYGFAAAIALGLGLGALIFWFYSRGGQAEAKQNEILVETEWNDDEAIKKKLRDQGNSQHKKLSSKLMHGIIDFHRVIPIYDKYLRKVLATKKSRLATIFATLGIFIAAVMLPITGVVPSEFFPASDIEYMYINIEAPTGLNLSETNKVVAQIEERLLKYPEISNFSTVVGGSTSMDFSGGKSSSHLGSITINLVDADERDIRSYEFADKVRADLQDVTGAKIVVDAPRGGPPSGAAFEARIMGEDLQDLDKIAHDLEPLLASINGVTDPEISLKQSPADYTFTFDPIRMELYNLNAAYAGSVLRMAISGTEVTTIIKDGKETKVIARFDKERIPSLEAIQNIQILNMRNQPVFLKDVAKIELKPSVETITRIDQKRTVLLSAGVSGETRPNQVLAEFQDKLAKDYQMPEGYEVFYGGENEQNTESVLSIIRAMAVAGLLIISTLIIQFNSFRQALIVLVTIPLALIGVFFGMALTGVNLTFPRPHRHLGPVRHCRKKRYYPYRQNQLKLAQRYRIYGVNYRCL
jgi:multidrug efflux pump subunit AcrB